MKIKFKKSLMLTALSTFAVGGALTPIFTMSACGNGSSSASGGSDTTASSLNAGLPPNWTQQDLETAVNNYADFIKTKSDAELMQSLNDFMKQLNDANTTAYNGLSNLAVYTPPPSKDYLVGSWALKDSKTTIEDVYNFFVSKTSKNIFLTLDQIANPPSDPGQPMPPGWTPPKYTPQEKINNEISACIMLYRYIAPEFTYAKMSAIVQQLLNNKALENETNIKTIATTLFIMNNNANEIYYTSSSQLSFWESKYMHDTLNKFVNIYNQIPFTITNADLEKQIELWYGREKIDTNPNTGLNIFTIYTTTPSVVTPKTPTSPTA